MAIDLENTAGVGIPGVELPLPDGDLDSGDAAALTGTYMPGTAAASSPASSTLFLDLDIEVVRFVFKKKDGSGSSTYNFALDYWWADAIYTGSPVCYPLLAESPAARRSSGINVANRHTVNIRLFAHTPLDSVNRTLQDLRATHDFSNAEVEIRYYSKATDGLTSHSDSINIRQKMKVVDHRYSRSENIVEFSARDITFDDKELGHRFVTADFGSNVDNYKNQWRGEVAPLPIGDSEDGDRGVMVTACPLYSSQLVNDGSGNTYQSIKIIAGIAPSGQSLTKRSLYIRNPYRQLDPRTWLPLSTFPSTHFFASPLSGPTTLVPGVDFNMQQWRFARRVDTGDEAELIGGCRVRHKLGGTVASGIIQGAGQLRVIIKEAVQLSSGEWVTLNENSPGQANIDPTVLSAAAGANYDYFFNAPAVLLPNRTYFFICEWTNSTDTANCPVIKYDPTVITDPCYTNDQTVSEEGWTLTPAQFQMQVWRFGAEAALTGTPVGDYNIWTLRLDNTMRGVNPEYFDGIEFKIGVGGITDDTAGNYDSNPSSLDPIENPASLIHFALQNDTFGAGVSVSDADYGTMNTIRAQIGTGLKAAGVIETELAVSEFIAKLCNQFRLRFYSTRDGKATLNFPTPLGTSFAFDICESQYKGDVQIVSFEESPEADLINKVDLVYNVDVLNLNQDAASTRNAKDSRFLDLEYIYPDDSGESVNDDTREALAAASQARYGTRAALWKFDFHVRPDHARKVLNYYFDRYHNQRGILTVRVLRRTWYNSLDLFSKGRVRHSLIPTTLGNRSDEKTKIRDSSGNFLTLYSDGIPLTGAVQGEHSGEILDVVEQGGYMTIAIETMDSFEGYV